MKRLLLVWIAALGCSTVARSTMVSPPGSLNPANAPDNEASRPGIVSYSNDGLGSLREARRKNAYKQMAESCNGHYHIDAEGPQVSGGYVTTTPMGNGVISNSGETHAWYIQFSCLKS
jgi:hypothetical protein